MKPLIGFITWNRMGSTVQNLDLLLKTTDDFDLYIIDNHSTDDTVKYLKTITDPRIKEIKSFDKNYGVVYAVNYGIYKRRPGQPFMHIENDVSIYTPNFVSNLERIMAKFPEIGILGNARSQFFTEKHVRYEDITRDGVMARKTSGLIGSILYFPSTTLDRIGYLNEETCFADLGLPCRVHTLGLWTAYCMENHLEQQQFPCEGCNHNNTCSDPKAHSCYKPYIDGYRHKKFAVEKVRPNLGAYIKSRTPDSVYCGSIHDLSSQKNYDKEKAQANFKFFSE